MSGNAQPIASPPPTGPEILRTLRTVDGIGSGLDADLVRGQVIDLSQLPPGPLIGLPGWPSAATISRQRNTYPTAWLGG